MKNHLGVRLLIALSMTTMLPLAMAIQDETLLKEPGNGIVVPEQIEPKPKPESKSIMPVTGSHGQLLYENHCQVCHTSIVHVRETHRARSLEDVEYWVTRWSGELKLAWSADEISDVVDYLNRRFYKIGAPSK